MRATRLAAIVARSLGEVTAERAKVTRLLLRGSPDLMCSNIMCGSFGGGCACRLALALSRAPALEEIDVRDSALPTLPLEALEALPSLKRVRAEGNALSESARAALAASRIADIVDI